jgi:phosphate transport system substrate-binding protein
VRKIILSIIVISIVVCMGSLPGQAGEKGKETGKHKDLKGTITLSGAWALYPMVVRWAEEFQKIHPKVKIDVGAGGAGKGMADCLAEVVDIGMVSRDIYPEEIKKGAWWVSVTKDAVVPTANESNPLIDELLTHGISLEACLGMWITGEAETWGDLLGTEDAYAIHVYTRSDACGAAKTWAKYMGKNQEDLLGVGVYGDPGLAEAVRKDALGIGFNNINYVYDTKTRAQVAGITVLPLDLNADGEIDTTEAFYSNRDAIVEAIAVGKYPSPPARDLHFVCHGKPQREIVSEFVGWVLTEGQKYVPESGYINLPEERLKAEAKKLFGE